MLICLKQQYRIVVLYSNCQEIDLNSLFSCQKRKITMAESQRIVRPQAGFQEKFVRSNVDVVIGGGVLSPQPTDSLIATPNGFVSMGDIKAGDIICDTKGGLQKVNYVVDKGMLPCVEFTLSDGRTVQSALDHEWLVRSPKHILKRRKAQEIIEHIDKQTGKDKKHINRFQILLSEPIYINNESDLKINPYLLGCLLGDGWFSKNRFYMGFCTTDKEMVDNISALGYNIKKEKKDPADIHYEIRNKELKEYIRELGLLGKHAKDKFIPECYKNASVEDRKSLLQGLFDTDGHCTTRDTKCGYRCGFRTISQQLAYDVRDVIWSLGGKCTIHKSKGHRSCIDGRQLINVNDSYGILAWLKDDKDLFRLSRKKDKAKSIKKNTHALSIREYKLIGEKHCKCINVSSEEHLYLTDNYVVTCNCGKTAGAVLSTAEPTLDSNFRAVFLRNNLGDAKAGGGILDEFKNIFGIKGVNVVESGDPHVDFPSGSRIDVTHIADQSYDKVMQRFKGRQYDMIYFDEMTGFTWECFTAVCTRNRGKGKWTGKIRGTTNPDRDHWLRTFLDWYIGIDGFIREDREGVVRYFYINGETVKDVVWGDSKEEVYRQCKIQIDRKVNKVAGKGNSKVTYKDFIQSFTFYLGRMSENKAIMDENSGYVGAVAMAGGRSAEQLLEGNWNVSVRDALDAPIPSDMANQVFMNDPQINGDYWITCDLADTGTDNFLAIAWNGFHIIDILILGHTTPRQNAEQLKLFAEKHDVADSHIIYDAIRGTYINDYIEEAIPFYSYAKAIGMYGRGARQMKDECYMRLIEMIKRGDISIDENVAVKTYEHQKLKERITIQNEFMEECAVVRFKDTMNGKKTLMSKKEMNQHLGKGRSMDLLDPCAMRMMPVLHLPYGDELVGTSTFDDDDDDEYDEWGDKNSIYDDSTWC